MGNAEYMGSAVQSSPLTTTLTMRAFLTVFLAVAVCGEADPYTIGQVLAGRTAGGVITRVSYPGVGTVAGFPYTAVHTPVVGYSHPVVYGKREAEADPEPYTVGQVLTGQTAGGKITHVDYGHGLPKVAGFPYTAVHAVAPVVHGYSAYPFVYGKREAEAEPEPYTVGQVAAGAHIANAIADGRPHNVGVITNAAIAPVYHGYSAYHPYIYGKREAEPFYGYGAVPYLHHAGIVANTGLGHAVAVTGYGHVTHSSNVGVCTNVAGVQVPC